MRNPRIDKLAKLLINHSCSLKPSERVLIETIGIHREMIIALIREAKKVGATPIVRIKDDRIIRELCICYNEDDVKLMVDCELYTLEQMNAFIGLRGFLNINELSGVPRDNLRRILKHYI